jgi:hypothetical protein
MTPLRRAVLSIYGVSMAFIFVWVPWRGYEVPKDRGNAANLGYGLVWSPPRPPAAFVQYYEAPKYEFPPPPLPTLPSPVPAAGDRWRDGLVTKYPPAPEGYISPFAYKTAAIDYGRVGLEFGALTALALGVWMLTTLRTRHANAVEAQAEQL